MRPQLTRYALSNPASRFVRPPPSSIYCATRPLSSNANNDEPTTASLNPRWLSDLKTRIGKCIMFGLSTGQTQEAGSILQEIALDWRGLVGGSEGFLTDKERRGLYRQEVVWGEMYGHVNNVVYNRYAESARVNWTLNFANFIDPGHKKEWLELVTPCSTGLILRSIRTDYKFPMKYPDRVTVLHKLRSRPESDTDHFILDVLILSELHRRPAARCVEDIVVYDYRQGKKAPFPPFMVDKLIETWELQEQAKQKYGNKVTELIRRVRGLEKDSWDRPDAKEDMGSAAKP
ncbi:thioesterase-like superfamily-domain-containing protein [Dendryphion nanum]|uniref:Thioesterase-like superfamily-domain-containing protein n=1 Tax=Dendryphion nanum TaxID=256645 RepID=A0A9P9IZV3_9PLEO|nr:thioesterase-like superfamily-domain-containing protein [Dendryphion nanum]